MRTTVSPLPSAVYWRRRAVVLGAVLLGIIVLFVSCSGDDKNDKRDPGAQSSQPGAPPPAAREPSFLDGARGGDGGPAQPPPDDAESPGIGGPNIGASGLPTL